MSVTGKKLYVPALCMIVFLQMGGVGLAPMLADMRRAFPQYSVTMIQLVSSLPSMLVAVTNLFVPVLCRHFPHKYIMAAGCGIAVAFSFLGFFFHGSLAILYIWSALLGIGTSIACTVAQTAVNKMFAPKERVGVYGKMAFTASTGSMLMTFAGGFLVRRGWYFGYLAYLIAVSGLTVSLVILPKNIELHREVRTDVEGKSPRNSKMLSFACISAFFVGYLYNIAATNISMLVAELNYGDSETAGLVSTVMLLVGGIAGIFVNRIAEHIQHQTMTLGYMGIWIGYLIIFYADTLPALFIAAMIFGGAISFVMPFAQVIAADADKSSATAGIAFTIFFSSIGMLLSPLMTSAAYVITGTELVKYRFLFGAVIGFAYMVFAFVFLRENGSDKQEKQGRAR